MGAADLSARERRLAQLPRSIALEISVATADGPMLYLERQAYLVGLRGMQGGIEGARVVLAQARQRMGR